MEPIRHLPQTVRAWVGPQWRTFTTSREPTVWVLALVIGIFVSFAAIAFREAIGAVQSLWLGTHAEAVVSASRGVAWYWILAAPIAGGLVVGWLLERFLPGRRTGGVADVIEANVHGGRNIELRSGILSALTSALSLGSGASAGREGPIVHLGATIATSICQRFALPVWSRKTVLACGVAAAVSASFNAPIAGVLFAHEVVLGHYAKRSFVPIVIASAMGTILTHQWYGNDAAFSVPDYQITSYLEFPAFALLGVTCGLVAVLFQFALVATDSVARDVTVPLWLRPAIGGALVGCAGIFLPHILGVGYQATDMALRNGFELPMLLTLVVAKTAATAVTLASRFGGGVFSPSLYVGAMTGGAFGLIAASAFPALASSGGLYAILGMGAVAAAVIGAPISTVVIIFELTGGYSLSIALLLTVSIAVGILQAVHGRSFFQWQLERRGVMVVEGPHKFLIRNTTVASFMERPGEDEPETVLEEDPDRPLLTPSTSLEQALRLFDEGGKTRLPVVRSRTDPTVIGHASQVAALRTFNNKLVDQSEEEHR